MDVDGVGAMDLEEWLHAVRGPLKSSRASAVREAFAELAGGAELGAVPASRLRARFRPEKHPDVESGQRSRQDVWTEFLNFFCSGRSGRGVGSRGDRDGAVR